MPEVLASGITLESVGPVLNTTTAAEAGMGAVLDAYFGAAADGSDLASVLGVLIGTTTPTNSEFAGRGYLSDLSISAPFTGRVASRARSRATARSPAKPRSRA